MIHWHIRPITSILEVKRAEISQKISLHSDSLWAISKPVLREPTKLNKPRWKIYSLRNITQKRSYLIKKWDQSLNKEHRLLDFSKSIFVLKWNLTFQNKYRYRAVSEIHKVQDTINSYRRFEPESFNASRMA